MSDKILLDKSKIEAYILSQIQFNLAFREQAIDNPNLDELNATSQQAMGYGGAQALKELLERLNTFKVQNETTK